MLLRIILEAIKREMLIIVASEGLIQALKEIVLKIDQHNKIYYQLFYLGINIDPLVKL